MIFWCHEDFSSIGSPYHAFTALLQLEHCAVYHDHMHNNNLGLTPPSIVSNPAIGTVETGPTPTISSYRMNFTYISSI